MNSIQVLDIMYQTFQLVLKLAPPFLLMSMVVGVTIAIFRAATQINEQTMSFVPKLLSILAMVGVLGNSVPVLLQSFTRQILSTITGGQFYMSILFSLITMCMGGAIALNPIFGRANVPSRMKAAFILVISLMLYIGPGGVLTHEPAVMTKYGVIPTKELLFSFTLGSGMKPTSLAVRLISTIMDYSMGLTMTQVYDPQYNTQMTIATDTYYAFMVMLSLAINGHLRLLTIFSISCELIPFGTVTFGPELVQAILPMFRESIAMGFQFMFPLIAVELVVETTAGILMQMILQIGVFVANLQTKIIVGTLMLLFFFSPILDKLYVILNGMYQLLQQIATLMRQEAGRRRWGLAKRNGQEGTGKPISKRRGDTRKRGNVFQSKDVSTVATLLGIFMMVRFMMPHTYTTIRGHLVWIITGTRGDAVQLLSPQLLTITAVSLLKRVPPPLLTTVMLGTLSHKAQTCFNVAFQVLQPRFSKLNPITDIKNLFFLKKVVELSRNLTKISLLLALLYNLLRGDIVPVVRTTDMNLFNSAAYTMNMVFNLVIKTCMAFTVIVFFDSSYQHREYEQGLKMTKQEAKNEYRQTEGDPKIKGRVRRTQRQTTLNRVIQRVLRADVIVRSPTHSAATLRYDPDKSGAPIVLAEGQDGPALWVIKAEEENGIAVIENGPLARALYASCKLSRETLAELCDVVAEILVFTYKVNHREDMFR